MTVYITLCISLIFISWILGFVFTAVVGKSDYYKRKLSNLNFIKSEKVNSFFGVAFIKWLVKNTFFGVFNQKIKISGKGSVSDLNILRIEMTRAEIGHLFGFMVLLLFALFKVVNQEYLLASIILLVNCFTNLYPSLLQQQNKRRIDKLIRKFKK